MALAQRMSFIDGGFRYLKRDFLFRDVRHISWWEETDSQTGQDGKRMPRYRSRLKVKFANGKSVYIMAKPQWGHTNATIIRDVHNVMVDAAEKLLARTFDYRMDAYNKEFSAKGYLRWDNYQITPDGSLYYRNALCFNLNDPQVRCLLYPYKLVAMLGHTRWWGRLFMRFVSSRETIELDRDRDCFLFLLRHHIGLYWPNEKLRVYRGMNADGSFIVPPSTQPHAQPHTPHTQTHQAPPRESFSQQAHTPPPRQEEYRAPPPPPPPTPKPRLGEEHYLGVLELRGTVAWPEVKSAYRKLAKQYHPDLMRGRGAKDFELKVAEDKLKTINEAYAWLEDYYRMKP